MARPSILVSSCLIRACDGATRRAKSARLDIRQRSSQPIHAPPPPPPVSHRQSHSEPPPPSSKRSSGLWLILSLLPAAGFFYSACFSIGTVGGGSMTPTLNPEYTRLGIAAPQDWVILNRAAASTQSWKVGDIVVLISPTNPTHLYTKRLIGLPEDVVRYQKKRRVQTGPHTYREVTEWARIKLPRGYCWVESDSSVSNTGHNDLSRDSRHFGPIPMGLLTARVSFIIWPLNRIGRPASRPDLALPGQPGLKRGWWPFGHEERKKSAYDSPLTPYVEDNDGGAPTRKTRFVDSVDVVGQEEEPRKKKVLNKNTPMDEMSAEEREKTVQWLNSLSRGGSLGNFQDEEQ